MTSQQIISPDRDFRYRIHGIRLEPETSKHDIIVEIQADGARLYKLPRIEKGQTLAWNDLYAFCDVHDGSLICLQVTEVHRLKDRIGRAEHQVFQGSSSDSVSIVCSIGEKSMFMVHMRIMGKDATKRAYMDALDAAKSLSDKSQPTTKSSRSVEAIKNVMALSRVLVELDPTGGAEAAFWVCTKAWEVSRAGQDHLEAQEQQNVTINDLLNNLGSIIPSAESVKKIADANLRGTLNEIEKLVEDVSLYILSIRSRNRSERIVHRMLSSGTQGPLDMLVRRSQRLQSEFQERMLSQTLNSTEMNARRERLKELNPAQLASYNPSRCCLDGTRVSIIHKLTAWVTEKGTSAMLAWVHGLAGLGKSSIMTSVCRQLNDQGLLAGSFFCNRDSPELRDPRQVLTTLVFELAQHWDAYGVAVSEAIRKNVGLHLKHIQPLYEILVARPWKAISQEDWPPGTLALVVDALDESGDIVERQQLLACLRDMSQVMPFVRIIIASRPENDIRSFFISTDTSWYLEINLLQYDAGQDIHRFVQQSLSSLSSVEGWPSNATDLLAARAGGVFIWARTACAYILSGLDRVKRLKLLTEGRHLVAIDKLYEIILTERDTIGDEESAEELRNCLGTIVASSMRRPLSVVVLATLMGRRTSRAVIQGMVDRLSSVLYIDGSLGGTIRVFHPSFMDYLTDRTRSKSWYVDLAEHNATLASACLQTMRDELKFNICVLETSDRLNRDIPDLDARTQRAISPQLIYACEFWSSHLADSPAGTLGPVLHEFLSSPGLMYWLEALSLLGKLSVAPSSLLRVAEWCTANHLDDCYAMAQDAYRFVLAFYDPIASSTPHLYISALSMAPANSQISKRMSEYFLNLAAVVDPIESDWTPCIRSISAGTAIYSVAMSPDDKYIVSGSSDGTVRIWDAKTGEVVLVPLQGHSGPVNCVMFSNDGRRIASGSFDKTIRIWNAETGAGIVGPLRVSGSVSAIAWSHDDSMIASGSGSSTIRLWCSSTGKELLEPLQASSRSVTCIAFSPDDHSVACGFSDSRVRVWDTKSGNLFFEEGRQDMYPVTIRFFQEGPQLFLRTGDSKVHTWDIVTHGHTMHPLGGPSSAVESAVFMLNNNSIVCAYADFQVAVWDVNQKKTVLGPLSGHSDKVLSVACSHSSNRIVSGSLDTTIRVWDAYVSPSSDPSISTATDSHWDREIRSPGLAAAFSSDGGLIASAHLDNTVSIWDAETGRITLGPILSPSDGPEFITFASDSSSVSCAFSDGMMYTWDIGSGLLVRKAMMHDSSDFVRRLEFSADGQLLATKSLGRTVRIWNTAAGTAMTELPTGLMDPTGIAAFSPDNHNIALKSRDGSLHVWNVPTGSNLFKTAAGHSKAISVVVYSPDGLRIASGSFDATICIWDALTGELLMRLSGNTSAKVYSIAFSHNGSYIVSGSDIGTLNIWDTTTGEMVCERFLGYEGFSSCIAISPNDQQLISVMDDGFLHLVDLTLYLRPDLPVRRLPGTEMAVLPEGSVEERLLVSTGELARHINDSMDGWVTRSDGKPLIWLPHELRRLDDSYMRISRDGPHRHRVDFTQFVHGEKWTSVKAE
ncbi:hypothetical protein RhiLY_05710 [Ceratobasidium sp. AG-Ba]|nr:hypothetical protein RhiLY_05710 [Ceratobasidium sp. AG-Ba]